jgi:hypothetical protein
MPKMKTDIMASKTSIAIPLVLPVCMCAARYRLATDVPENVCQEKTVKMGCITKSWLGAYRAVFVLRQAQHERKNSYRIQSLPRSP